MLNIPFDSPPSSSILVRPMGDYSVMRLGDRLLVALLLATIAVSICGTALVHVQAQSQELLNERLAVTQQGIELRMSALEALHLSERLAVLERSASEVDEIKKVALGIFAAVIVGLVAQIVQIRNHSSRRR